VGVSLRGQPVEQDATLPDGRRLTVRVAVANDPYIPRRERGTVTLELVNSDRVEATVNTLLAPNQVSEARRLADEVVTRLQSGELPPTASAIEPFADSIL
jgi:methylase of polypeptide subunit release factors